MPFGGTSKRQDPPPLPPPVAKVKQVSGRAAGEAERQRTRGRRGRRGAIFAGRRQLQPANIGVAGLKQDLG